MERYRNVQKAVSRALRSRWTRFRQAEQELLALRMSCDGIHGKAVDLAGDRRMQHATGDKTGGMALRLAEAEARFERCRRWVGLGEEISSTLGATFDGQVFDRAFDDNLSDRTIARDMACSRDSVIRSRERILSLATCMAAERGLIHLGGEEHGGNQ